MADESSNLARSAGTDARAPEPVRPSIWAGLTSGATVSLIAQLFEDPYRTVISGIAGIVGPTVMAVWPSVRRFSAHRYRIWQTKRAIADIEEMHGKAIRMQQRPEHIAALEERLERAQLQLLDDQTGHIPTPPPPTS